MESPFILPTLLINFATPEEVFVYFQELLYLLQEPTAHIKSQCPGFWYLQARLVELQTPEVHRHFKAASVIPQTLSAGSPVAGITNAMKETAPGIPVYFFKIMTEIKE